MTDNIHPSKAPACAHIQYFGKHRICSEDLVAGLWLQEWHARRRRERIMARVERVLAWLGVI